MVVGSPAARLLDGLPSCCSRVVAASSSFPLAGRLRSFPQESFPVEVTFVQRPPQPPPLPRGRIPGRHVVLALPRHVVAPLIERRHHTGAVLHPTGRHELQQVHPDLLPHARLDLIPGPAHRPSLIRQMRRRPGRPRPRRVVRTAPAMLVVERVAERVVRPLPPGRRNVQAQARRQVAPRCEEVHVNTAVIVPVKHHRPRVAVRVEARPGGLFELVDEPLDLGLGRRVLRRPSAHPRRVPVLEGKSVGHRGDQHRVAAQDLDRRADLPRRVLGGEQVGRSHCRRTGAAGQELQVHSHAPRGPDSDKSRSA